MKKVDAVKECDANEVEQKKKAGNKIKKLLAKS
jgi:hypothetical protein